jgi:hypothetical protein
VHFVAQRVFPSDEAHPFIDLITDDPRIEYLLPIALAALIAAPVVEEYVFRVLLQGWLERVLARWEQPKEPELPGGAGESFDAVERPPDLGPGASPIGSASDRLRVGSEAANPFRSPQWEESVDAVPLPGTEAAGAQAAGPGLPERTSSRLLAIGVSSLAFSLAHFGQGPAPISLFLLALGLGYLYQRTHRVLPSITVHFLVNLTAVVQLALAILENQS